ncbi:hypothetical protein V461_05835 [Pantoea ananatis BRT98]|nr:hypothetical protein V461_05835 [Pantoea ananatis BRT98]
MRMFQRQSYVFLNVIFFKLNFNKIKFAILTVSRLKYGHKGRILY